MQAEPQESADALEANLKADHRLAIGSEASGGELIAFLIALLTPDLADIEFVFVAPGRRREGLASRLIKVLAKQAGQRGIGRIGLEVSEGNQQARALYRKLGFQTDHCRLNYYRDGSAAYLMSRNTSGFAGLGH